MMLLSVNPKKRGTNQVFIELTSDQRWTELEHIFVKESNRLFALSQKSMLAITMQYGISCLKTVFCEKEHFFD
jgi:hypothetical protein